jgi:hypothetical protein
VGAAGGDVGGVGVGVGVRVDVGVGVGPEPGYVYCAHFVSVALIVLLQHMPYMSAFGSVK